MRQKWLYTRWFALIVGLVLGAVVGLAVYGGSRLTGASLYALCGTVAGGVAAVVFYGYSRTIRLTELTVSIPQLTDLTFAVTPGNERVAWRLFVESVTRASIQPVDEGTGILREALDSLYGLFTSVRAILVETAPTRRPTSTQTVEHLAIAMLNLQLRPFLSTWHARLTAWEKEHPDSPESAWPDNAACRAALEQMRLGLVRYVRGLGQLAGAAEIDSLMSSTRSSGMPDVPPVAADGGVQSP
jgi:hypothetical protein